MKLIGHRGREAGKGPEAIAGKVGRACLWYVGPLLRFDSFFNGIFLCMFRDEISSRAWLKPQ